LLAILWLFLVYREIEQGPELEVLSADSPALAEAD
jgi:hypothetical protein